VSLTVALGLRAHSGWAATVVVAGSPAKPTVLERRRIVAANDRISGSKQPYHAAKDLSTERAETWIRQSRHDSTVLASQAVNALVIQLRENGLTVVRAGILFGLERQLPPLQAILRSHALIHTAEGEFFRNAVRQACERSKISVTTIREPELDEQVANAWGDAANRLQRRIANLGSSIGPPWTKDYRLVLRRLWEAEVQRKSEIGWAKVKAL